MASIVTAAWLGHFPHDSPATPEHVSPIAFGAIGRDEYLEIDLQSRGCFGGRHLIFYFRAHPRPEVIAYERDTESTVLAKVSQLFGGRPGRLLGAVDLSREDIRHLDNLLRFYRNVKGGGCTTVERIVLRRLQGGRTLKIERYMDASCGTSIPEGARLAGGPILPFDRIVDALEDHARSQPAAGGGRIRLPGSAAG